MKLIPKYPTKLKRNKMYTVYLHFSKGMLSKAHCFLTDLNIDLRP